MKLLTLDVEGVFSPGILVGDNVLDLARATTVMDAAVGLPAGVKGLIAGGEAVLEKLRGLVEQARDPVVAERLQSAGALTPFEQTKLAPVIPDAAIVLSGSMNSREHCAEMGDPLPSNPCGFHKLPSTLSASGSDIVLPPDNGEYVDFEGEFCVVLGARCHRVTLDEAEAAIAGYTLMNDVSAREFAFEFIKSGGKGPSSIAQAWERNVLGKNFPTFGPIGPVVLTCDELPSPLRYKMETRVNGVVMQSSTQADLVFGPAAMISYFSQFLILEPGDIISLGSPPGVGMARKPPVFLKQGDVVEVVVDEIGTLHNAVVSYG